MKPWLLSLILIAGCALTLHWLVRQKVVPRIIASANGELVADWHAAFSECHQETGVWPDPDNATEFVARIFDVKASDGRRIERGYMTGRSGYYTNGVLYDLYGFPLRVTVDGDRLLIASAGPNRQFGDADDITSDEVKERYHPTTLALARAEAEAALQKKK